MPYLGYCITDKTNKFLCLYCKQRKKNDAEFATKQTVNKKYIKTFRLIVRWSTGIDEKNVHTAKHITQTTYSLRTRKWIDNRDAWIIHVRYTVNEEPLGW